MKKLKIVQIGVGHDHAAEMIRKEIKPREVIVTNIYPSSGINCGPGLFAAFYYGTKITDLSYEKGVFESIVKNKL